MGLIGTLTGTLNMTTPATNAEAAERRRKMATMMGGLSLALLVTWFFVPLPMRLAIVIVGMVTTLYAVYNLVLYRYRSRIGQA